MSCQPYTQGSQTKATSTYSLSKGLASILHERGIKANANLDKQVNPGRFESIVSETISSTVTSTSDAIYSKAELNTALDSISLTARPLLHPEFTSLFEQIKDIGLKKLSSEKGDESSKENVGSSDIETDTETVVDSESDADSSLQIKAQTVLSQAQVKPSVSLLTPSETTAAVSKILNVWKASRRKTDFRSHYNPPIRELPSYLAPMRDLPLYLHHSNDVTVTMSPSKSTEPSPTRDAFSPMADDTPFTLSSTAYTKIHNGPIASPSVTNTGIYTRQSRMGLATAILPSSSINSKQNGGAISMLNTNTSLKVATKPVTSTVKSKPSFFESEGVNIMRQEFYNDPNLK